MSFHVTYDGEQREVHLEGRRILAELLSEDEFARVENGSLVAVTPDGDLLDLSARLQQGDRLILRPPRMERDFQSFGFPVNRAGDIVRVAELLRVRAYEEEHGEDVYDLPLDEIRERLTAADEPARPANGFFVNRLQQIAVQALRRTLGVPDAPRPVRRELYAL